MYADAERAAGACGISVLYFFQKSTGKHSRQLNIATADFNNFDNNAGCGWYMAGFIDTAECKQTYQELKKRFPIIYQSEIRHNINSDNNFFFAVFDTGQPDVDEDSDSPQGFENGLDW